ncbi:hypothetical protein L209DRAFT_587678 [Thermothelomyces heterothallicus CBS 203.75]
MRVFIYIYIYVCNVMTTNDEAQKKGETAPKSTTCGLQKLTCVCVSVCVCVCVCVWDTLGQPSPIDIIQGSTPPKPKRTNNADNAYS